MSEEGRKSEFTMGYLIAAAQVQRGFDQPTIAYDLMCAVGVTTRKQCRDAGLEEYDLKPLYAVLKLEGKR